MTMTMIVMTMMMTMMEWCKKSVRYGGWQKQWNASFLPLRQQHALARFDHHFHFFPPTFFHSYKLLATRAYFHSFWGPLWFKRTWSRYCWRWSWWWLWFFKELMKNLIDMKSKEEEKHYNTISHCWFDCVQVVQEKSQHKPRAEIALHAEPEACWSFWAQTGPVGAHKDQHSAGFWLFASSGSWDLDPDTLSHNQIQPDLSATHQFSPEYHLCQSWF